MLFAEGHDGVWQTLITAVAGLILAWMNRQTQKKVDDAAKNIETKIAKSDSTVAKVAAVATKKHEEVKAALIEADKNRTEKLEKISEKLDDNTRKTECTLRLANGDMTNNLRLLAEATKRIADLTEDPNDIARAELAIKAYKDHQAIDRSSKPNEATIL